MLAGVPVARNHLWARPILVTPGDAQPSKFHCGTSFLDFNRKLVHICMSKAERTWVTGGATNDNKCVNVGVSFSQIPSESSSNQGATINKSAQHSNFRLAFAASVPGRRDPNGRHSHAVHYCACKFKFEMQQDLQT